MDDQIAIAAYKKNDKIGRRDAIFFVEQLSNCYDKEMVMENEATNISQNNKKTTSDSEFNFLEATVIFSKHKITIKHLNKNQQFIEQRNKQKRFRYQHFESFTPNKQKMGTVIETAIRMSRYTSCKSDLIKSIKLTIQELKILLYPTQFIKKTLQKIYIKDKLLWDFIPNLYRHL